MRDRALKAGVCGVSLIAGIGLLVGCSEAPRMDLSQSASAPRQLHDRPLRAASGALAERLYVDPTQQSALWAKKNPSDERAKTIEETIANKPAARWFGDWNKDITAETSEYVEAAADASSLPVLVAYNIYGRDCGSYSAGGVKSPDDYRTWITSLAEGIGSNPAVVILEPDTLAQIDCIPDEAGKKTRLDLIKYGVEQLAEHAPRALTYIDGGNANWIPPATMADRLAAAGVDKARGFSVNVSNFYSTAESDSYAGAIRKALASKHGLTKSYVVDTSRNGNGSANGEWCNPAGRKLGTPPRLVGLGEPKEFELWIKAPGESDGTCGAGTTTTAGEFAPDLAVGLVQGR